MFIELAELICCPESHEQVPCILAPEEMDGRRVVKGTIACPICRKDHSIAEGIVGFGEDPLLGVGSRADDLTVEQMPDAGDVQALLNLDEAGGYVALFGSAGRLAGALAAKIGGVHFIGYNPPPDLRESPTLSLVRAPMAVPIKDNCVRAVMVGREYVRNRWMREAGRLLTANGRLVAVIEEIAPPGVTQLAVGKGMWVGEKQASPNAPSTIPGSCCGGGAE